MNLKDIGFALRVQYVDKLSVLTYNGVKVPVYDSFVPDAAPNYFVVIKDHTEADDSLKQGFNSDVHVTLDIVTRFNPGTGSSAIADKLSGDINGIICTTESANRLNLLPDFHIMNSVRTMSKPITEQSKTYNIIRKINIYKHVIQQLV